MTDTDPTDAMKIENTQSINPNINASTAVAHKPPALIPIQIDISYNHLRLKDSFLWRTDDASVTVEEFACRLCEDLDFPPHIFVAPVVRSMRAQIEFYSSAPASKKEIKDEEESNDTNKDDNVDDSSEKRYLLKVDLVANGTRLQEIIEWDVNRDGSTSDPEFVARSVVADLGASREVEVTLAHHLRAQSLRIQRAAHDSHMEPLPVVTSALRQKPTQDSHLDQLVWPLWSWPKKTV